jgi:PKHD-type hydroxylase
MKDTNYNWVEQIPSSTIDSWIQEIEGLYPLEDSRMGSGEELHEDLSIRSTKVSFINEVDLPHIWKTMLGYALHANKWAYGFDVVDISSCQYAVYDSSTMDFYDWHSDTHLLDDSTFHRKITVIIQLSDPSEYKGGYLQFNDSYIQGHTEEYTDSLRKKGSVITFPSFVEHRVTPVTEGTRRSLVCWVEGPKFR